jgi:hypothetical protein
VDVIPKPICSHSSADSKQLVVVACCTIEGKHTPAFDWLHTRNKHCVILVDKPVNNKGREGSAYLRYIIDQYDSLPEYTLFLQHGEFDYHDWVYQRFANKSRTLMFHHTDLRDSGIQFLPVVSSMISPNDLTDAKMFWEAYVEPLDIPGMDTAVNLTKLGVHWCCSQFLVHRDLIRSHPKYFYEKLEQYTIREQYDELSSRDLEHTFHIIFTGKVRLPNIQSYALETWGKLLKIKERGWHLEPTEEDVGDFITYDNNHACQETWCVQHD